MVWFENRSGMYLKVHEHRKRKLRHLQAVRDRISTDLHGVGPQRGESQPLLVFR